MKVSAATFELHVIGPDQCPSRGRDVWTASDGVRTGMFSVDRAGS
jgi:hypothetical protein